MKKKVLLVVPSLEIGGRERIAINTAEALLGDYEVEIAVFQDRKVNCYEAPCNVINLNVPAAGNAFGKVINQVLRSTKLLLLRKKKRYDVVFSFGSAANTSNALSSVCRIGKSICAIHGFAEVKRGPILSLILKMSDTVICIAKAMQAELLTIYPKCTNSIVIENGYVLNENSPPKKVWDDESESPIFVSMGRIEHVKGFDVLVKAFAIVHSLMPKAKLWLIGDGSLREAIESEVNSRGLANAVKLWGYQKNPHDILEQATSYVLSSRNEGLPNALIEALNAELPVIAIDCKSGPREILTGELENKENFAIEYAHYGILVENHPDDDKRSEYLAEAMIELIRNHDVLNDLRSKALDRAKDYSLEVYAAKIRHLIDML